MIRIRQVKLNIEDTNLKRKVAKVLKLKEEKILDVKIIKKSLDARHKNNLLFSYTLDVLIENENNYLKQNKNPDIFLSPKEEYIFNVTGDKKLSSRPIIVGSGPAGLFAAYLLAKNSYNPLIIERGETVDKRVETVEKFFATNKLNINSNVQFGEGGAGTFSDGKLNTLVKDKYNRNKFVLETFVEFGAPEEILYDAKPHIGTDILRTVVKNMRNKIISLGGEFRFNTCLTNINYIDNKLSSITVNDNEEIPCEALVLAIGHSARDTFQMLYDKGLLMEAKPFAVGVRIEHPQKMINKSQYGVESSPFLTNASYKLTYQTSTNRGVYSFCMCPGGYVVNASSEEGLLAVNGMSNYKRESANANSALVVTVSTSDFGQNPLSGIEFQRRLERAAYNLGNGKIPLQLYKDFKENKLSTSFGKVQPITKGAYSFTNLNEVLPNFITDSLKEAIEYFGTKIEGFNREDALLLGVESRTSSPVRMPRNDSFEANIQGIYPCGEGAGYAGGITTSAIDGMKVAESIAKIYSK